jgi:hypothetical protein
MLAQNMGQPYKFYPMRVCRTMLPRGRPPTAMAVMGMPLAAEARSCVTRRMAALTHSTGPRGSLPESTATVLSQESIITLFKVHRPAANRGLEFWMWVGGVLLAVGESVVKCPSPLNMPKDTHDHSCYRARSDEYQHCMIDSPVARCH